MVIDSSKHPTGILIPYKIKSGHAKIVIVLNCLGDINESY